MITPPTRLCHISSFQGNPHIQTLHALKHIPTTLHTLTLPIMLLSVITHPAMPSHSLTHPHTLL